MKRKDIPLPSSILTQANLSSLQLLATPAQKKTNESFVSANQEKELLQDAWNFLKLGDYANAKQNFAFLLQKYPEDMEYQAAFFAAGWWYNRLSERENYRSGRSLASWYMRTWEKFMRQVEERKYNNMTSITRLMRSILEATADNFRQAFQEEGGSSADTELLQDLALCLLQLEDYNNAVDILQYARNKKPKSAELCFLLGESFCCQAEQRDLSEQEEMSRSLTCYRDAFFFRFYRSSIE